MLLVSVHRIPSRIVPHAPDLNRVVVREVYGPAMLTPAHVRELALGLPEATEQDHHGRPSFRVRNRIFATLWTPAALNVMPGEEHIRAAVETSPDMCAAVYWGKRLRAVRVDLRVAESELVGDLLFTAWRQRVPRRLQAS